VVRRRARARARVLESIAAADFVLIGPSNPFVSIDPILAPARTCARRWARSR